MATPTRTPPSFRRTPPESDPRGSPRSTLRSDLGSGLGSGLGCDPEVTLEEISEGTPEETPKETPEVILRGCKDAPNYTWGGVRLRIRGCTRRSRLPLKQPYSLSRPGTVISNPKFGEDIVYIYSSVHFRC